MDVNTVYDALKDFLPGIPYTTPGNQTLSGHVFEDIIPDTQDVDDPFITIRAGQSNEFPDGRLGVTRTVGTWELIFWMHSQGTFNSMAVIRREAMKFASAFSQATAFNSAGHTLGGAVAYVGDGNGLTVNPNNVMQEVDLHGQQITGFVIEVEIQELESVN